MEQAISLDRTQTKFGDVSTRLQYFISTRFLDRPVNIQLAGGLTIPINEGVRNVENDNRNLTSGTLDPVIQTLAVLNVHSGWSLIGSFFTRQVVGDANDFRAGDSYRYQMGVSFAPVGASFDFNAQMRYLSRGQDIVTGVPFANSGGDWLYFAAGGSKALFGIGESAIRLWGEVEAPLYQDVNGNQLVGNWTIRAGFNFNLALLGHKEEPDHDHGEKKAPINLQ